MNTHRQHGVVIGGKRYTVDEHGKFHLIETEPEENTDD